MSGFPGAGKDTWLAANYPGPVISLDAIREQIGMPATGDQGAVLQRARLQAKERLSTRKDFAWNATNVSRELRGQVIELAAAYNARVRIVWLEAPRTELWERNRTRPTPVAESVIDRMMERWETPDPWEAHDVRSPRDPDARAERSCDLDELDTRSGRGELLADIWSEAGCGDLGHQQPDTIRGAVQKRHDVAAAIGPVGCAEKLGVEQADRRRGRRDRLAQIQRSSRLYLR